MATERGTVEGVGQGDTPRDLRMGEADTEPFAGPPDVCLPGVTLAGPATPVLAREPEEEADDCLTAEPRIWASEGAAVEAAEEAEVTLSAQSLFLHTDLPLEAEPPLPGTSDVQELPSLTEPLMPALILALLARYCSGTSSRWTEALRRQVWHRRVKHVEHW